MKINELFDIKAYLSAKFKNHIMSKGTVKFYNETKGFGFIKEENSTNEYFVHSSGLVNKIKEDDVVTFELAQGKKGLNAVNVKLA